MGAEKGSPQYAGPERLVPYLGAERPMDERNTVKV